jgi:hypothetical protein
MELFGSNDGAINMQSGQRKRKDYAASSVQVDAHGAMELSVGHDKGVVDTTTCLVATS